MQGAKINSFVALSEVQPYFRVVLLNYNVLICLEGQSDRNITSNSTLS